MQYNVIYELQQSNCFGKNAQGLLMGFYSILFEKAEKISEKIEAPDFFSDLNIDQIIDALSSDKAEYNLKPFFYTSLKDADTIKYRQEIMRDLENPSLMENIKRFAQNFRTMREYLALSDKLYYKYPKERWFLDAAEIYCDSLNNLLRDLSAAKLTSRGLSELRKYLAKYTVSDRFVSLQNEIKKIKTDLSKINYCLLIKGNRIKVRKYESEIDYSANVEETFRKFKRAEAKDYRVEFHESPIMNHVEAKILDLVAKLYPEVFLALDNFCTENSDYLDRKIAVFDREIQFYIAYLEFIEPIKQTGLKFCYPEITTENKEIYDYEGFDLALAYKHSAKKLPVVYNDFYLKGKERIFVITGPNQGGKTTFARSFGQLHYLASIGCPVPGKSARLFLYDKLFTHFEKEEKIKNLRGKLEDDLARIYDILNRATKQSIVIMNEIFTSTTFSDAVFLSKKIIEKIDRLDLLCVWVTFVDELIYYSNKTVSMVSTVNPANPAIRTYKIQRKPASGLAYAMTIAEKYHLTYTQLKERIKQ